MDKEAQIKALYAERDAIRQRQMDANEQLEENTLQIIQIMQGQPPPLDQKGDDQ